MGQKVNCWEFKKCGRERGGAKVAGLGVCPVAVSVEASGMNGGRQGGRICWALTGTLCGGKVQGSFAQKLINCMDCEFYRLVLAEEGSSFKSAKDLSGA